MRPRAQRRTSARLFAMDLSAIKNRLVGRGRVASPDVAFWAQRRVRRRHAFRDEQGDRMPAIGSVDDLLARAAARRGIPVPGTPG